MKHKLDNTKAVRNGRPLVQQVFKCLLALYDAGEGAIVHFVWIRLGPIIFSRANLITMICSPSTCPLMRVKLPKFDQTWEWHVRIFARWMSFHHLSTSDLLHFARIHICNGGTCAVARCRLIHGLVYPFIRSRYIICCANQCFKRGHLQRIFDYHNGAWNSSMGIF
jgi:hypothetical protein